MSTRITPRSRVIALPYIRRRQRFAHGACWDSDFVSKFLARKVESRSPVTDFTEGALESLSDCHEGRTVDNPLPRGSRASDQSHGQQ